MEFKKLDSKAKKSWRIGKGIFLAIATIVLGGAMAVVWNVCDAAIAGWAMAGAGLLWLIVLAVFLIFPVIEYRQWGYFIGEDRVEITHGIFFIERSVIPIIRIQNITVSQGPINRSLGLFEVEIFTASGSFVIPCLDEETAEEVSTNLKDRIYLRIAANGVPGAAAPGSGASCADAGATQCDGAGIDVAAEEGECR